MFNSFYLFLTMYHNTPGKKPYYLFENLFIKNVKLKNKSIQIQFSFQELP